MLVLAFVKYRMIAGAIAKHASFKLPATAVTTTQVQESEWQESISVVGSLAPVQGVIISAEEPGKVVKIGFESGAPVQAGDLLVKFDTSVEEAELQAAEAKLDLARINMKRNENLRAKQAVSESAWDEAVSTLRTTEGATNAIRAMIARKTVVAPFAGRAGIRMINVGEFVTPGTQLVPLQSLNPLYLNISIPQSRLAQIRIGQEVNFTVDLFGDKEFSAKITAIDPQLDEATRNVRVQATVDNSNEQLKPGMFAKVEVAVAEPRPVLAIPGSAVSYAPYGNSVFVVEKIKDPKDQEILGVTQHFVKLGQARGDLVAVLSGLKAGQEVVTSGVFRLRPGAEVVVNNSITPGNSVSPKPADT